jgi:hypothetical protein
MDCLEDQKLKNKFSEDLKNNVTKFGTEVNSFVSKIGDGMSSVFKAKAEKPQVEEKETKK